MIKYGENLKEIRISNGKTLLEVEKDTHISNQNLSRWENEKVLPNIDFCVQLADYYGISLDELVGRDNYIPQATNTRKNISNKTTLSDTENEITKLLQQLPIDLQRIILAIVKQFVKEQTENQTTLSKPKAE